MESEKFTLGCSQTLVSDKIQVTVVSKIAQLRIAVEKLRES